MLAFFKASVYFATSLCRLRIPLTPLTCAQQLLDDVEVGVRDAVVQRRVPVAVRHVDHVPQHGGGEDGESLQVVLHHGGKRQFLAGHAEPLVLHRVETSSLCIEGAQDRQVLVRDAGLFHTGGGR